MHRTKGYYLVFYITYLTTKILFDIDIDKHKCAIPKNIQKINIPSSFFFFKAITSPRLISTYLPTYLPTHQPTYLPSSYQVPNLTYLPT
jgi:hypothetical protein